MDQRTAFGPVLNPNGAVPGSVGRALALIWLLAGVGCGQHRGPKFRPDQVATFSYTIEVQSRSGRPLSQYPILVSLASLGLEPERHVTKTNQQGKISGSVTRTPAVFFPWDPALRMAKLQTRETLNFYLPEIHSEGKYQISFLMDERDSRWQVVAENRQLVPPERIAISSSSEPGEVTYVQAHGAVYFSHTGTYQRSEILANGTDLRQVPMIKMDYGVGEVPREPMLQVVAASAPLQGRRGYHLDVVLRVPAEN